MSIAVTGANTIAETDSSRAAHLIQAGGSTSNTAHATCTATKAFGGLTAGPTTFTAKYKSLVGGNNCDFQQRTVVAIAL
jgi:hypothetical protein